MKKRILSLLLCIVMCLSLMPTVAFAEDTGYALDSDGNLTITSNAGVTNWNTEISDKSVIKTITVGENVLTPLTESMGFDSDLTNLQTIAFEGGSDLTDGAFSNCLKLESVTFKSNPRLRGSALSGCTALKTLTFESTSEIKEGSLTGCSALETITFGGLTYIGSGALSVTENTKLKELVFPGGSSFQGAVFNNYTGLESITFEDNITLKDGAFSGLDNLKTVVFKGPSTLQDSAFSNCPKLESVTFKDTTHIKAGALTCDSGAPNTVLTEVEVPDNSIMSGNTFAYYTALKTVKLGKGAYFYWSAFYGADGITDVYFADETPVTFWEKALASLNPAQVTLHVPTCDAVGAYAEELKKDPVDEADTDLHNAAFVSCLVADAHNYGVWTSVSETQHQRVCANDATHVETANHTFSGNTCTDCGYTKSVEPEPCNHSETEVKDAKDATCTENGYTGDTYCKDCGEKVASGTSITAIGHSYGSWTSTGDTKHERVCANDATHVESGEHTFSGNTCTVCGYTKSSSGGSSSGGSAPPTYAITVADSTHGSISASAKTASAGDNVKIIVSPDKGYTLETITVTDKNGKEVELSATKLGETYTFKMPAGAVTVKASFIDDNTMLNYFVDVTTSDYYYDAVLWAAETGITGGVDAAHFAPSSTCTRAQAVTFLWRAAGRPEVAVGDTFTDVVKGSYYEKAVAWALANGITSGTSATTFSPDANCTRAQIVCFLYRANKVDTLNMKGNPFTDVAEGAYYYDAVLWAAENGITGGTSATTFSPDANCTRAQIVTFLYRYMGK